MAVAEAEFKSATDIFNVCDPKLLDKRDKK